MERGVLAENDARELVQQLPLAVVDHELALKDEARYGAAAGHRHMHCLAHWLVDVPRRRRLGRVVDVAREHEPLVPLHVARVGRAVDALVHKLVGEADGAQPEQLVAHAVLRNHQLEAH